MTNKSVPTYPVYQLLDRSAQDFPDNKAFDFLGKSFSWKELHSASNAFAKGLQLAEVKQGTKIGLFLPNCPQFLIAYYGALKAGMTVVNYNPLYSERDLAFQIEDSETDILVTLDLTATYDKAAIMLDQTRLQHIVVCRFIDVLPFPKNLLFPVLKSREIANWPRNDDHSGFDDIIANDGIP
jgi:long-chain acyl-CoA synthetase